MDGDLLDLQAAIDQVGHQMCDGLIVAVGYHPEPAGVVAGRHHRQRPPPVPGDLGHADIAEHQPCRPLDGLQGGEFCHAGHPNAHQFIVAPRCIIIPPALVRRERAQTGHEEGNRPPR